MNFVASTPVSSTCVNAQTANAACVEPQTEGSDCVETFDYESFIQFFDFNGDPVSYEQLFTLVEGVYQFSVRNNGNVCMRLLGFKSSSKNVSFVVPADFTLDPGQQENFLVIVSS